MSTWNLRNHTAIVGVGYTPMVRASELSIGALATQAALAAIADAGLRREDIDGYVGSQAAPFYVTVGAHQDGVDEVSAGYVATSIGMHEPQWLIDIQGLPTTAVGIAAHVLASGVCKYVLLMRAMYNPVGKRYQAVSSSLAGGPSQYTVPYGMTGGIAMFAPWLQRYMHDYGATREALFSVVENDRKHAQLNPVAYWRGKELTLDDYMNAPPIYSPLNKFDCDIPVTGAGAVVMTTAERAKDLRHKPAYVAGVAHVQQPGNTLFDRAGVSRKEVQVAQLYDGFSPFVWMWLEQLGLCERGTAHQFTQGGRIGLGGELPVNTFGGQIGEGRLHGMGHLREGAMQIMGRCGERQVPNVANCVVTNGFIGPNGFCTLMLSAG